MNSTLLFLAAAQAATIVVDPSGAGDSTTLSGAASLLSDGDALEIRAGTYAEQEIYYDGVSDLTIRGEDRDTTIIAGPEGAPGLVLGNGAVVSSLSFRNQSSAVQAEGSTDLEVHDCAFYSTVGVFTKMVYGEVYVHDNTFIGGDYEGAVTSGIAVFTYYWTESVRFENNVVAGFNAGVVLEAPFVTLQGGDDWTIVNNTFAGVSIPALSFRDVRTPLHVTFANNIVLGTTQSVALTEPIDDDAGRNSADVGCNLFGTTMDEPYGSTTTTSLGADVSGDPLFVAWSDDEDWTNDDLRLTEGSPAIDIGCEGLVRATTDADGDDRALDGDGDGVALPDAGAYEYHAADAEDPDDSAAETPPPADPEPRDGGSLFGCAHGPAGPGAAGLLAAALLALRPPRSRPRR
jgi:hypothetical protein